ALSLRSRWRASRVISGPTRQAHRSRMNKKHEKTQNRSEARDAPAYTLTEAARYLRLPAATLRSWILGRDYPENYGRSPFPPLLRPASRRPPRVSFSNLIEAHVLRSLRIEHEISVKALRTALHYAERELGIDRLLLREELSTNGGRIFLDRYGELIELTASGQVAIRVAFDAHLRRVEWQSRFAARLYPFVSS